MKTKRILFNSLLAIATTSLILTGCKKDEEEDNDTDSSKDNAFAESMYSDAANISDEAGQKGSVSTYKVVGNENLLGAATVTKYAVNPSDQDTIIVDFGTTNNLGNDGRNRRGKIIVLYTGKFKAPGSTHTIKFDNYYVNDNKVDGSKTVKNNGKNTAGNMNWTVSVNGTITLASGAGSITWTSSRNRELLSGWNDSDSTITWNTSKWSITGSANGTSAKGVSYSAVIQSALIKDLTCTSSGKRHFTKGVVEITPSGKPARTIDFGSGACDDVATVTIKGKTFNITLK
jgi:hypothetical protein